MARRARGSIPAAGCDRACNAARRPKALSPEGLRRFWRWPALLAWPRSLRISALRSRLAQRQNRRNATPSYFLDALLAGNRDGGKNRTPNFETQSACPKLRDGNRIAHQSAVGTP